MSESAAPAVQQAADSEVLDAARDRLSMALVRALARWWDSLPASEKPGSAADSREPPRRRDERSRVRRPREGQPRHDPPGSE